MMCLVQTETYGIALATVRWVAAELPANAIGLRWSDEDELGDRGNATGGEQSTGKLRLTTMYSYL